MGNNPSYTTKNRTPLLSSRGVNLFGKHPRDEYNDDNDNERVKRQKVQKENEELTARVKELETEKDGMKVEHTEALATKQLEIDRLTTEKETIQMQKEEADQKIRSLNARLESEQQEHEKALAGLQTEIKTLKENETSQSSNDEVLQAQKEQFKFVCKVLSIPGVSEYLFHRPRVFPNSTNTIKNPMWFGKIMNKFSRDRYNNWDEFVSDCRLVFTNAIEETSQNIAKIRDEILQRPLKTKLGDIQRMQAKVEEYIKKRESKKK